MQPSERSSNRELTLQLDGNPDASKFASFIYNSTSLVNALSNSVLKGQHRRRNKLRWYANNVSITGGAEVSYEAPNSDPQKFELVESAFFEVGNALRYGGDIPYSQSVADYASRLRKIVRDDVESLIFINQKNEAIVRRDIEVASAPSAIAAYDEVEGRIETISSRKGLRFILYDSYFDRAVTCYLDDPETASDLTDYFGKVVRVMGLVTRDSGTDRPFKIKNIGVRGITLVEKPEYSWRDAENIIQFTPELTPEGYIRKLRDA